MVFAELIKHLADGQFHSGQQLASQLGVSRAAVWKQIKQLHKLGLKVDAVNGRGYRLEQALSLLDAEHILQFLAPPSRFLLSGLQIHQSLEGTNAHLLQQSKTLPQGFSVVLAEHQSAGRGRRGRDWHSPYGANLYCSLGWQTDLQPQLLQGLSLVVGLAVVEALRPWSDDLRLKWPNDIYVAGRKLGGILIEMRGELGSNNAVIIGLGLNLNMQQADIDQDWISLQHINGCLLNRNQIAATVVAQIIGYCQRLQQQGFTAFQSQWQQYDYLLEQSVQVSGSQVMTGVARGIDSDGALLVETGQGIQKIYSGDVSVRAQQAVADYV